MIKKLTIIMLLIVFVLNLSGCSASDPESLGLVKESKTDDKAIKEVVTAYYAKLKNFRWQQFDKYSGLEFWTDAGKEEMVKNSVDKLEESIKRQKISSKLKKIDIKNMKIDNNKATVDIIIFEDCKSEINENLTGILQSQDRLELEKVNNLWRISNRSSQMLKVQK